MLPDTSLDSAQFELHPESNLLLAFLFALLLLSTFSGLFLISTKSTQITKLIYFFYCFHFSIHLRLFIVRFLHLFFVIHLISFYFRFLILFAYRSLSLITHSPFTRQPFHSNFTQSECKLLAFLLNLSSISGKICSRFHVFLVFLSQILFWLKFVSYFRLFNQHGHFVVTNNSNFWCQQINEKGDTEMEKKRVN